MRRPGKDVIRSGMVRTRLMTAVLVPVLLGLAACSTTSSAPASEGRSGIGVLLPSANGGPKGVAPFFAHRSGLPETAGDDIEGYGFTRDEILGKLNQFALNPYRVS